MINIKKNVVNVKHVKNEKKLKKTMKKLKAILLIGIFLFLAITIVIISQRNKDGSENRIIRLAVPEILGAGAPFFVVDELNLLDKYIENAKIKFVAVDHGPGLNEGIVAGRLDGGSINITNFLIGIDKGVPYKLASSVGYGSNTFVTNNPDINTFADITKKDKIAVPGLAGTSILLLRLAAQKYFDRHDALDEQIIVMGADEALFALINKSGGITVTTIDIVSRGTIDESGCCKTLLNDRDLFEEELMQGYLVLSEGFYNKQRELTQALLQALEEAIDMINNKDEKAIQIISKRYKIDKEDFIRYLDNGEYKFAIDSYVSLDAFSDIALKSGIISSKKTFDEMVFN